MKIENKNLIKSLLERRKKFGKNQKHLYHMVTPSIWPFMGAMSALTLTIGAVMYMHSYLYGGFCLILGICSVISTMFFWWRDVILEATFGGYHTKCVVAGLRIGMILFILSEVMFFFSFFWAFFHASLAPSIVLGGIWPPLELQILNPFHIPLLNTLILLTSGITVTLSHYWVCTPKDVLMNFFRINYNFAVILLMDRSSINIIKYLNGFENREIENIWIVSYKNDELVLSSIENYNLFEIYKNNIIKINKQIFSKIKNFNVQIVINKLQIIISNLFLFKKNFLTEFITLWTLCKKLYPTTLQAYKEVLAEIDLEWNKASDVIDDHFDEVLALDALDKHNETYKDMIITSEDINKFFIDNIDKELSDFLTSDELKKYELYEHDLVSMRFFLETFDYLRAISPIDWWIVFAYLIVTWNLIKKWFSLLIEIPTLIFKFLLNQLIQLIQPILLIIDNQLIIFWNFMKMSIIKIKIYFNWNQIKELWKEDALIEYWLLTEIYYPHRQTIQKWMLWITILLAIEFTIWQAFEYYDALFYITDGIYGSTFYVTTGFHGLHVIIGTIFLIVCCIRLQLHHFRYNHHFGYEAAIWYWHFVDVVWLFLFMFIYIWGSGI